METLNQGKTPKQMEDSYKIVKYAFIVFLAFMAITLIIGLI